ncbi:MAG TPA: phosphatidylinositol mannoside acyltransferase [Actinomycetota bacterium]|nr:phosphatidylinositol mannoside acyltransferase [Actinomycetota bacterium]
MPRRRPPDEGRLLQLVYHAYVAFSALARALPEKWAYALARFLGDAGARFARKQRMIVEKNLARITGASPGSPEMQVLVTDAYRSYARYWLETFRLVREGREFFLERFVGLGDENIESVRARGKGALVVVGHLGNWDAGGAWIGATGRRLVTVAEPLRPRRMFDFFVDHRAALGMTIYPAEKGVTSKLIEELDTGAVVAILGDRDLKGTGPEIDFFGEPATFPVGAAAMALKSGVPLLFAGVRSLTFDDGRAGWECEISEPIELPDAPSETSVRDLTAEVVRRLEAYIARYPTEWHVFQPFWVADRKP